MSLTIFPRGLQSFKHICSELSRVISTVTKQSNCALFNFICACRHCNLQHLFWKKRKHQVCMLLNPALQLSKAHLNGVQFWTARWKENQSCTALVHSIFKFLEHVNLCVVHHHNRPWQRPRIQMRDNFLTESIVEFLSCEGSFCARP